jgi:hypothetical protein
MKKETTKWGVIFALLLAVTCAQPVIAGELEPPPGEPGPTMHTLEDIYRQLLRLDLKQCIGFGERMCDLHNGTLYDPWTGLTWLKDANCFGPLKWDDAMAVAASLEDDQCGLSDESIAGDWRLPSAAEWTSVFNTGGCLAFINAFFIGSGESWSNDKGSSDPSKAYVGSCGSPPRLTARIANFHVMFVRSY